MARKYELVWSDEFDGNTLDRDKWTFETGGYGFGNAELQYYTENLNAIVENSFLKIEARKQKFENCEYTSAKLTTYGKKHFQYGRFEVKAKVPKFTGSWPAIWLLPVSFMEKREKWPLCGEIDLMEHVGHSPETIHFSLHTQKYNFMDGKQYTSVHERIGCMDEYVEYAMDWLEDRIDFYMDGKLVKTFKPRGVADNESWPFNKPYYFILNLAVGGHWGGEVNDEQLPQTFNIEYVKYYKITEIKERDSE